MEVKCLAAVFGVLLCCGGGASLDCSQGGMQRAQLRCFNTRGLNVAGMDAKQLHNVIQNDPTFACKNPEAMSSAFSCAMNVGKKCLAQVGQSADILPDAHRMSKGIQYLCRHINDIDVNCAKNTQTEIKQCAMVKAMEVFSGNTNSDVKFITCKAFEIAADCIPESMKDCSGRTSEVYLTFTNRYATPPACNKHRTSENQAYKFSTHAPTTTARLVTMLPLPHVSCYSEDSVREARRRCFARQNIDIQLPKVNLRNGMQAKQSYMDAILANNDEINRLCRAGDLQRYQTAIGCTMDVARHCMPASYKSYLPSSSNMKQMLSELCTNLDDMNYSCVASKASDLFECGYHKGQELASSRPKVQQVLCMAFKYNVLCQKQVLPSCGCQTTKLYMDFAKKYLNPPACPKITYPSPVCDHDHPQSFVSHDASASMKASFLAVTSSLLALAFLK